MPRWTRSDLARAALAGCFAVGLCLGGCREDVDPEGAPEFEVEKTFERGPVTLVLKLSRKEITIAEGIALVLEVTAPEDFEIELPRFGEKLEQFGITDYRVEPARLVDDDKTVTVRSYELEPFLSGDYRIPPMKIAFWKRPAEGEPDPSEPKRHEIETEELTVKVKSILPEKMAELDIEDIEPPVELPVESRAWLYAVVGLSVAAFGILLAIIAIRRRSRALEVAATMSADELAWRQVEELLAENLVEKGQLKPFYRRLSAILRTYIENRFGLRAPERTTEEFLEDLATTDALGPDHKRLLEDFLAHCDLVKFAELQPTSEQIQGTFDACKDFIESTKSRSPEEVAA